MYVNVYIYIYACNACDFGFFRVIALPFIIFIFVLLFMFKFPSSCYSYY